MTSGTDATAPSGGSSPGEATNSSGNSVPTATRGSADEPAAAVSVPVDGEALAAWLDDWRELHGHVGVVAGVKVGDAPAVIVASGREGRDVAAPLDPAAPYFIASLTKSFVAALMLQLEEDGVVSLDDPASAYIDLWPAVSRVTIRQLLSHTSGLPSLSNLDSREWLSLLFDDLARVWTTEEALAVIEADALLFPPGDGFHYSNANYIVAGLVVEAATGRPLAEELRTRLIEPLGLDQTYLQPGTGSIDPRIPQGVYATPGGGMSFDTREQPLAAILSVVGAAGAMVSTPADVLDWVHALYGGSDVLTSASQEQMSNPARGQTFGTEGICPCRDGRPLGLALHGIFIGFETMAAYYPLSDVALVIYVNDSPPKDDLEDALVAIAGLVTVGPDD